MKPWGLAVLVVCLLDTLSLASPRVYTGYSVAFEKAPFADENLPENQDHIVDGVAITRASTRGIYNIAQEEFFTDFVSPAGTSWAFPFNNPGATLMATNWPSLIFQDWQTATGGAGGGPPATVNQNAVLHLVDQDIYLDIRFTSWGAGFGTGGSFSYVRAVVPIVPEPTTLFILSGLTFSLALLRRK